MLYRMLRRLLEKGLADSMAEKIEAFYAAARLSEAEYRELVTLLHN